MIRLLIISDDFTGALDTGVQFAAYGARVRVVSLCLCKEEMKNIMENCEVLVINTETRHLLPEQAYKIVRKAISCAAYEGIPYVYKKVDSVLRGNIGSELEAVYLETGEKRIDFIPAFPQMGRITEKGIHYVKGIPIAESIFSEDPFNPVKTSYIPDIIREQCTVPVTVVEKADAKSQSGRDRGIFIYDAGTQEDIRRTAEKLKEQGQLKVMAGCAGFAQILPEILGYRKKNGDFQLQLKKVVAICGSVNRNSREQLTYAQEQGIERITVCLRDLYKFSEAEYELDDRKWEQIKMAAAKTKALIINVAGEGKINVDYKEAVSGILGKITKKILNTFKDSAVYIIGGDTVCGFLKTIGCKELEPVGEVMPGVVASEFMFEQKKRFLISKSGGFGPKELMIQLLDKILEKEDKKLRRHKIAITVGDPSGIGGEIVAKALKNPEIYQKCIPIVIGDRAVCEDALEIIGIQMDIHCIHSPEDAKGELGTMDLIDMEYLKPGDWTYKKVGKKSGEASFQYIIKGIQLALEKKVSAVVTGPISKEAIHLAGHHYAGHTEIFAEYTGTKEYGMLLMSENLRVIHVTTHVSMRQACNIILENPGRITETIRLADETMRLLGIEKPRIAVAGLNAHCSENGLFGCEESLSIVPAVEAARALGIDAEGPIPPDTVFVKALANQYDVVVAMYHDQGHIPLKLCGFRMEPGTNRYSSMSGVNITAGLPIIRTSVDHGTAYGKAGEGRANEESLTEAIEAAVVMAEHRFPERKERSEVE